MSQAELAERMERPRKIRKLSTVKLQLLQRQSNTARACFRYPNGIIANDTTEKLAGRKSKSVYLSKWRSTNTREGHGKKSWIQFYQDKVEQLRK